MKSDLPVAWRALERQRVVLLLGKIPACRTLVSAHYCEQDEIELFQVALDILCHGIGEAGRCSFSLPFLRLAQFVRRQHPKHIRPTRTKTSIHPVRLGSVHA
jgi:hypothetical protein